MSEQANKVLVFTSSRPDHLIDIGEHSAQFAGGRLFGAPSRYDWLKGLVEAGRLKGVTVKEVDASELEAELGKLPSEEVLDGVDGGGNAAGAGLSGDSFDLRDLERGNAGPDSNGKARRARK